MSVWVKQQASQVQKHGKRKASWYCVWDEPTTGRRRFKSHGAGPKGRRLAQMQAEKLRAKIALGEYEEFLRESVTWGEFVKRYDERELQGKAVATRNEYLVSLNHLKRILKLKDTSPLTAITADRLAEFMKCRRSERGKQKGSKVSPATLNKDLRAIKVALRKAHEWEYIPRVPKFTFVREPEKLPPYVKPEHFIAIYKACKDTAVRPGGQVTPADWWRGLLMFAYLTGWRIGEILSLTWSDVDLEQGTALTRADENKGRRDALIALHPTLVQHLLPLRKFSGPVFDWPYHTRALYDEFDRIQAAARIDNEPIGARYTFHDFRRAFATMNALNMSEQALQALMRHSSPLTTKRYVNVAHQLNPAVANLYVPDVG
jgi:integrase